MNQRQRVAVLGATGSIGAHTLKVIKEHPERFEVVALSANARLSELCELALQFKARIVVLPSMEARNTFVNLWPAHQQHPMPEVRVGQEGLCATASDDQVDTVVAAIVGIAGLPSTLAAAEAGKRILLANKESCVAAGRMLMDTVARTGAQLLPVDSEHNALFQCLPGGKVDKKVRRLILTASGGPFLKLPINKLHDITPEQACAHPNWRMGKKISVDSATMMNKCLELIEAHYLFGVPESQLQVLIHPESTIHSMVEYVDGTLLAQLGYPNMCIPISYALGYPERLPHDTPTFDLSKFLQLNFMVPDVQRFPVLRLARQAIKAGQAACIVLNSANEALVAAFLSRRLRFTDISLGVQAMFMDYQSQGWPLVKNLDDIVALDEQVRIRTDNWISDRNI